MNKQSIHDLTMLYLSKKSDIDTPELLAELYLKTYDEISNIIDKHNEKLAQQAQQAHAQYINKFMGDSFNF